MNAGESSSQPSFGVWKYCLKSRKKYYVSLNGKKLLAGEAFRQCKIDDSIKEMQFNSARLEFCNVIRHYSASYIFNNYKKGINEGGQSPHVLSTFSEWGIPGDVVDNYHSIGMTNLFPWQIDCLTVDNGAALNGRNLLFCAPTSGGKTLVAEILMLRRIGGSGVNAPLPSPSAQLPSHLPLPSPELGTVLFVVPFVSLAEEKTKYFQEIWAPLFLGIRSFHGGEGGGGELTSDVQLAICTIERANVIFNTLLENRRENQISMVVVDEIHMMSDSHRGFLLEILLSKILYIMKDKVQIVGMSATLPNLPCIANWLQASLYSTSYRPVALSMQLCVSKVLYQLQPHDHTAKGKDVVVGQLTNSENESMDVVEDVKVSGPAHTYGEEDASFIPVRSLKASNRSPQPALKGDDDGFIWLCLEPLWVMLAAQRAGTLNSSTTFNTPTALLFSNTSASVMLFCPSKQRCETCADRLAAAIQSDFSFPIFNKNVSLSSSSVDGCSQNDIMIRQGRYKLIHELHLSPVGICPKMKRTIPFGIVYHHAGITVDERKLLEQAFRDGIISVMCTTSTLSAGVNLPTRRVVIREPKMGPNFLTVASYRQMCGRAGRTNMDSMGEAILMIHDNAMEKRLAKHLMCGEIESLCSALHKGYGGGLEKLILELVCTGRIVDEEFVNNWRSHAVQFLLANKFIACQASPAEVPIPIPCNQRTTASSDSSDSSDTNIRQRPIFLATALGRSCIHSGITPQDALKLMESLEQARIRFIPMTGFHAVYLSTPPNSMIPLDWASFDKLLQIVYTEQPDLKMTAEYIGVSDVDTHHFSLHPPKYSDTSPRVQFYRRFYAALLLYNLIQERPLLKVCEFLKLNRGVVQQLQKDAASFCGMAVVFCSQLNWVHLASIIESCSRRLSCGVKEELLPLVRIGSEMPGFRARAFFQCGLKSPVDIVQASKELILQILLDCVPFESSAPVYHADQAGAKHASHGAGTGDVATSNRKACERLAVRIIQRAHQLIHEELKLFAQG